MNPFPAPARRRALAGLALALGAAATLGLSGCASLDRSLSMDVSTFGEWPAGRAPGSYSFERLPSQEGQAQRQAALEAAARPALAKAGFQEAAEGQRGEVLVQLALRQDRSLNPPWEDPLWWSGGFGWRVGRGWGGPSWGLSMRWPPSYSYDREAAVLLRDRETGKPLYEARARDNSNVPSDARDAQALFEGALVDFPKTGINPRRVTVALPPAN